LCIKKRFVRDACVRLRSTSRLGRGGRPVTKVCPRDPDLGGSRLSGSLAKSYNIQYIFLLKSLTFRDKPNLLIVVLHSETRLRAALLQTETAAHCAKTAQQVALATIRLYCKFHLSFLVQHFHHEPQHVVWVDQFPY
jgi:hypothetical protein